MAYVKSRRLSLSLSNLINTDSNILAIALKYKFEYEQSYIRAFQKQFQITPAKYRKQKTEMPIEQRIDIHTLKSIDQGFVIQPKMVIKPLFHIQGIQEEILDQENLNEFSTNKLAMLFHEQYLPLVSNKINEHIYLAIIFYSANSQVSNNYMPCVETSRLNEVESPFTAFTIPLQEYAVFRYVGLHAPTEVTYRTLKELYDYITGYWQVNTAFKQSQPYHFERMDLSICSNTYCEMDLYFPLCT